MLAVIFLIAVALVAAQEPPPCTSPTQFESKIYTTDYSKNFTQYAKISYDELNKRVREIEDIEIGSERDFYDIRYIFQQNKEYRLNLKTRTCNVTTLTRPFQPFGMPPNARYDGQSNVGPVNIPNEHVSVIRYDTKTDDGSIFGSVTTPDCVPITFNFFSNRTGFVHRTFFDLTVGIPDPMVFDIPKECL